MVEKNNSLKLNGFDLYAKYCSQNNKPISLSNSKHDFLNDLQESLNKSSAAISFGKETEMLFYYIVCSLGKVNFIQSNDTDLFFPKKDVAIPDYLINIGSKNILIEVKNNTNKKRFKMTDCYMQRLLNYIKYFHYPLYIAIYWQKYHLWTIVDILDMNKVNDVFEITLEAAYQKNNFGLLGDRMIGALPKISFVFEVEKQSNEYLTLKILKNEKVYKIISFRIYVGNSDIELVDDKEKEVALFLYIYGNWDEKVKIIDEKDVCKIVSYVSPKANETHKEQGFEIIGCFSTMFTKQYKQKNYKENKISQIYMNQNFKKPFEDKFRGKNLKLWIFNCSPKSLDNL